VALELARHGALVVCADINDAGAAETVRMIEAEGGQAYAVHLDVGDSASTKAAFKEAYDKSGKITILVHGAAIVRHTQLPEMTDEEWDFVMNIDLTGVMRVLREVFPYMKETGGRIALVSSTSGYSGGSWAGPHYVAAKAGVVGLTKYCAREWAKYGIRVNTILPGVTHTPMLEPEDKDKNDDITSRVSNSLIGRIATPQDMAGAIMFLVSAESSYVTGVSLDVSGGRYVYGT